MNAGAQALAPAALTGRRAVVLGLGRFGGGIAAVRHLARHGARVVGTDLRTADELPEAVAALSGLDVELVLGGHEGAGLADADLVVVNPAVPPDAPPVVRARAAGALLTSEVELFAAAAPCRLAAVTGTQGKSSTTTFAVQALAAAGRRALAGGNLGGSLLDRLDDLRADDIAVLELSSYQLAALGRPPRSARPFEAVAVTNVLADHLERHGGTAGYAAAKRRILELVDADGLVVLPDGPGTCATWSAARVERFDPAPDAAFAGRHDLPGFQAPNLRAALALARELVGGTGSDTRGPLDAIAAGALRPFAAPPHRLERLPDLFGAAVWDNGVSTTPDSTAAALWGFEGPVVLVAGGRAKNLTLEPLLDAARDRVRLAVCFGEGAATLAGALAGAGVATRTVTGVEEAVAVAARALRAGDVLVFSPACASFDTHPNFRERAHAFRRALEAARRGSDERAGSLSS